MGSLLARLKELETNLQELSQFKTLTLQQIESDRKLVWALRYGMLESMQIHEYLDVDDAILFAALDRLSDLRDFAAAVADAGMNTT